MTTSVFFSVFIFWLTLKR